MITTHDLRYCYAQGPQLVFPDVALPQGGVLLLHGPSGCGKSTWLGLVAGLLPPHSGTLTVADQPLQAFSARAGDAWRARTLGFLPQKLHLSPGLTVRHNLELAAWASGQPQAVTRIDGLLDRLGVGALAQRRPAQLSGGQAQRVALARALLNQPQVLLADEPTASLDDAAARDAVALLLHAAATHGSTLVLATHDARVRALVAEKMGENGLSSVSGGTPRKIKLC